MDNTELDLATATADMTSAQAEAYFKSLPTETKVEPTEPEVETPKKVEEVAIPKDKAAQREKILKSQAHEWKVKAEKAEAEKAELLRKINAGEVENDMQSQEELLDKMLEAKLAKMNIITSQDSEKSDFMKSYSNEADLLPEYEAIVEANPTLSLAQARILYQAANPIDIDPSVANRERLARQATPWMSVTSEEKPLEAGSSDDIMKQWKALLAAGKINNHF